VKPTDVRDPNYFHKVVDCQWACPAHTNVPEYIRLIAQERYADAYMLNRQSNVFPGILGRTCDRPCEPACRRTRIDEKPVAICRLKRVAADLRGDISDRLPRAPGQGKKLGKRVACIGAGPASLALANDLVPLGYDVVMFEKAPAAGGLMRSNVPIFRLPRNVLDDEIGMILQMGVDIRYNTPIDSMKALLNQKPKFDAIFVGTGAPRGKELEIPGRAQGGDRVHIGIDWLEGVAFGHIESIGERVLIIGVGNTAMDCCRTSRRLGGKEIKVMARRPRPYFKASPWELEDAEEEMIEIVVNHIPKRFVVEAGKLKGMEFERVEWSEDAKGKQSSTVLETVFIPADDVILAIGQENAFPWIERDIGIEFGRWDMPVVDEKTFQSSLPGVFFGGDAAWGPKNIIWAVAHAHEAAISIHNHCQGLPVSERPPAGMNLVTQKMGLQEWSYSNDYNPAKRAKMKHVDLRERFAKLNIEVELGFDLEQTAREAERCLNCDVETVFRDPLCIECDACIDVCPLHCLTIAPVTADDDHAGLRKRLTVPAVNLEQDIFVSGPLPQTKRVMVKDEDVCVHCGLCAERCPTAAWDMEKFELVTPYAGQTGASK
jgi:NADPH-dependent glutamate synthase beta subunit-like oxidoreductase